MDEIMRWVVRLVKDNKVHEFYNSPIWKQKKREVLKQQHFECQRCKQKGKYSKARTVHHKKYLRVHPELALEDSNLEAICDTCHYDEHHRRKHGFVNEERW